MELKNSFAKFLKEIRPTDNQKEEFKTGHKTLRERIHNDEGLSPIIVETFLQGSYRRATAVRPKNNSRSDVDVILVTKLCKDEYTPEKAMNKFIPFLDKYYPDKYRKQGRSFGIELSYINIDLVITSAPSENEQKIYKSAAVIINEGLEEITNWRLIKSWLPEGTHSQVEYNSLMPESHGQTEWKTEPLWIPDRLNRTWEQTHPLEQIKWTHGKNTRCDGHYVNVVKAIKWWQKVCFPDDRLKGYPLEHLIGSCCPDYINSVADGIKKVFDNIVAKFKLNYDKNILPNLSDHGVTNHNVLGRLTIDQFQKFYDHSVAAGIIATDAFNSKKSSESSKKWRELLGDKFPLSSENDDDEERTLGPFVTNSPKNQVGDMAPRKYGKI